MPRHSPRLRHLWKFVRVIERDARAYAARVVALRREARELERALEQSDRLEREARRRPVRGATRRQKRRAPVRRS